MASAEDVKGIVWGIATISVVGLIAYLFYKWQTRTQMTAEQEEQYSAAVQANAKTLYNQFLPANYEVKDVAVSTLDSEYTLLRKVAPDGTVTTYRVKTEELSLIDRSFIEKGWFRVTESGKVIADLPYTMVGGVIPVPNVVSVWRTWTS